MAILHQPAPGPSAETTTCRLQNTILGGRVPVIDQTGQAWQMKSALNSDK
jgi:hypothetical protein